MAFTTFFSDIVSSFVPATALAESEEVQNPVAEASKDDSTIVEATKEHDFSEESASTEESAEQPPVEDLAVEEHAVEEHAVEEDEDDEDEDDEDEEDEEVEDPYPALRQKAAETVCHSFKHHFDECVERVAKSQQDPNYEQLEYKEDCVEEFFHLEHCINDNTANALFSKLR
ncbi:Non-heme 11 kDa protein of cytochrome bc1 complex [Nadsonia fulvescens var. elongata DSM 6958]|uniref:Non-heme 11 kDa protein of cytochrome bc1 complex n=1 Tax=Nadsonia fulvescens var. elongata DSM 6958 TaxID=857566 RepID=A0A1E3PRK3_9ASCO|nr:Non-heme 11 kDa protein of cytochrome bc1 complex [Nadsonia fulvescens var. elongata DSM 6958]